MSLLQELAEITGTKGVLVGEDVSSRKAGWLSDAGMAASAIVRPSSTEEVSAVLALCNAHGQRVVPLGGNTGLVEGTAATEGDIMLSLERMQSIEEVDADSAIMVVQAGAILQRVQERATEAGLSLALDFGARGSASIGGAIATNAGGNAVIRYGMAREQVLGLEVVLADGTILSSMNRMLKNNAGYDLKQLFIGSEGTLGVITRAVLRLRAQMPGTSTAMLALDDYSNVSKILRHLEARLGGTLSAFEVLWRDFYDLAVTNRDVHAAPVEVGHPYYILLEARGGDQTLDGQRFEAAMEELVEAGMLADAAIAQSGAQRNAMWAIRDDIDGIVAELGFTMAFDVSLPIADADAYTERVHARLRKLFGSDYRATTFGHLGDSNVHFMLSVGSDSHDTQRQAMEVVYEELRGVSGSISAEHGVGLEKRDFLSVSRSAEEIEVMKRLKKTLDPNGILNPGKIFDS